MTQDSASRAGVLKPRVACASVLILAVSFALYWYSPIQRPWSADNNDPADYRFVAEHFWGVPIVAATYAPRWNGGWGAYLRTVPFRGVGLGTLYLAVGWLRIGHAPSTPAEVLAAGTVVASFLKILLAGALLIVFEVVRRRWGAPIALLTLTLVAFPPQMWRFCNDFLAEPVERILFLLAFACAVAMTRRESIPAFAMTITALFLYAAHLKQQWYVAAFLLLPAILFQYRRAGIPFRKAVLLGAAALSIPLTLVAVNWIGWRTMSLSPGIGIHVNLKYHGDVVRSFGEDLAGQGRPLPAFADPQRPRVEWWDIYVGDDVRPDAYDALDRYATRYVRTHPGDAVHAFWEGIELASSLPGIQRLDRGLVRLQPIEGWPAALIRYADRIIWALLFVGLAFDETRMACALALALWIVPAIGNIFSLYELRYHSPMAGVGAAAAVLVAARAARRKYEA